MSCVKNDLWKHADHGRRKRGVGGPSPPEFWNFQQKKVVFLLSSGKKTKSPLLATPGKIFEKSPSAPLEKSFRHPWCRPSPAQYLKGGRVQAERTYQKLNQSSKLRNSLAYILSFKWKASTSISRFAKPPRSDGCALRKHVSSGRL